MKTFELPYLYILLIILILISAFFSASETAMMALNRYRLRHMARAGNKSALRVSALLERPDRLLGGILIVNTLANILASAVVTIICGRLWGDWGIALGTIILTFVILIFAEVSPKTLAATHAAPIAFFSSWPLKICLGILYPIIWLVNMLANGLLRLFNVKVKRQFLENLTREELHTLVSEAGIAIPDEHQDMLLAILGLENVTVEDILIPRHEIVGIDIEEPWEVVQKKLRTSQYTRLPVYKGDINDVKGILHVRAAVNLFANQIFSKKHLLEVLEQPYFVPETTRLSTQLLNFREYKARMAIVVDEYGDIQGIVTLEDILEEIVGEYTTNIAERLDKGVSLEPDGSYLVDGSLSLRELNRLLDTHFDISGPKTVNGMITEYLEAIPQEGLCLKISGYPLEITKVKNNRVRVVRILRRQPYRTINRAEPRP